MGARSLALAALCAAASACGPTVAARGAMSVDWVRDFGPPPHHGAEVAAQFIAEYGGARADPDACAAAGALGAGAQLGVRSDGDASELRYSTELAPLLAGGLTLRCGHLAT